MAVYEFEGKRPIIDKTAYVFPSADVIGSVIVGRRCFIGPGARIRGDYGTIYICDYTSVQDNAVIHALDQGETYIGQYVQVGHGSILHNCYIGDYAICGNGSVINDHARVGKWSFVGAGAVVPPEKIIENETIVVGNPAKFLRFVTADDKAFWLPYKKNEYPSLADDRYKKRLKQVFLYR